MIALDKKAQRLKLVPGNPEIFGSQDTFEADRRFDCAYHRNSSERNVRAGRDSAEIILTMYYQPSRVRFSPGDMVRLDDAQYDIEYIHDDSTGDDLDYIEIKYHAKDKR